MPSSGFVLLVVVNFNCLFNLQDHIVQSNKLFNSLCLFLMTTITKRIATLMVPSFNKSSHSIACSYYFSKRNILGDSKSDKVKHPASQECSTAVEVLSIISRLIAKTVVERKCVVMTEKGKKRFREIYILSTTIL